MEQEIFKVYKDFKHPKWGHRIWEVSNLGRVKCNGEIVEPYMRGNYLFISTFKIHRAVAELFIPNPENKPFVDHINTNTLDNRAENLRWVTCKENNNNPLTRKHMSEALCGKVFTTEHKRKLGEAQKGRHHSEETKRKISIAHKGKPNGRKGKPLSDEHKRKISESLKDAHKNKQNTI